MPEDGFEAYVVDQLGPLEVEARAMFGGHGLYHEDTIFGIVYEDRLYLKVDDRTRQRFDAAGMDPFQPRPGQTMAAYREVPAEVLDDSDELVVWSREAIEATRTA